MTKNDKNVYASIEVTGFQQICMELAKTKEENEKLKADNKIMADELTYFKDYSAELEEQVNDLQGKNHDLKKQYDDFYEKEYMKRIDECNRLWGELFDIKHMSVWEFANKYCNDKNLEDAGHAFARSLLGHRMTDDELAIEAAENRYKPYTAEDF